MTTEIVRRADVARIDFTPTIGQGVNRIARERVLSGDDRVFIANPRTVFDVREPLLTATVTKRGEGVVFLTADGEDFAVVGPHATREQRVAVAAQGVAA